MRNSVSSRKIHYLCESCGFRLTAGGSEYAPRHCGVPMVKEPVPLCSVPYQPGMIRSYYDDEPCDDGWSYRSA